MSTHSEAAARKPMTLHRLREMQAAGDPIAMLTCYDASFARALDSAGVDCLLVGDSLGMVMQGRSSTVPVTLADMVYHVRCVAETQPKAWLIGDLPFGSYQESASQAMHSATALMQAGAQMVKLEGGGEWTTDTVRFLVERGVPVCGHLGLTPQSVHALGGYRVQGRSEADAATLLANAQALSNAGAAMLVLELLPSELAQRITEQVAAATIGIGAGSACAGQVLVVQDMLGLTHGRVPRFVRNFMDGASSIGDALAAYVSAVKTRTFPDDKVHGY